MSATLHSSHLRLRAIEPEDAILFMDADNDTAAWYSSDMIAPYSFAQLKDYALTYDADPFRAGQLRLIAEDVESGEAVGIADFYEISARHRRTFCGIYLFPQFRGKGRGKELLLLMDEYVRNVLMLSQSAARILSDNKASLSLFETCGYTVSGVMKQWHRAGGNTHDVVLLQKFFD